MSNQQSSKENNSDTPIINLQNWISSKSNTSDILEHNR